MMSAGFLLLAALAAAALACAGALQRATGRDCSEASILLAMGVCLAPALLGLGAMALQAAGAGSGLSTYLLPALFMAFALAMPPPAPTPNRPRIDAMAAAAIAIGALACAGPLAMPLVENDALEYAAAADILNRVGSIRHFPMLSPDPVTGLHAPALHPPAFIAALAWMRTAAPEAGFLGQRLLSAWSLAGLLAATAALGARAGVGAWSALLILATPFLVGTAMALGIDVFRMAAFAAALAALILALERPETRRIAAAGAVAGIAMWTHSLGLLAPALGCAALALFLPRSARSTALAAFAGPALIIGGGWYVRNLFLAGAAVSDSWSIVEAPALRYAADLAARRGLDGPIGVLFNGLLRPWTESAIFGATFWLALMAHGRAGAPPQAALLRRLCVAGIAGYGLLAIALLAAGSDIAVKNPRYWLTLAPCAALLGALALAQLGGESAPRRVLAGGAAALLLAWSAGQNAIRAMGLAAPGLSLRGDEAGFLRQPRATGGPLIARLVGEREGRVLAFRPSEVVALARRPVLDHADPVLIPVHDKDPDTAFRAVRERNARWALVPDYSPVTLGLSALGHMLADPRFAEPLAAHRNARLYRLHGAPAAASCAPVALAPPEVSRLNRGPGDILAALAGAPQIRVFGRSAETATPGRSISWSWTHTGALTIPLAAPLRGRYAISILVRGSGVVAVDAVSGGAERGTLRLIDRLIDEPLREIRAQWVASDNEPIIAIRLSPLAPGSGHAELVAASICSIAGR